MFQLLKPQQGNIQSIVSLLLKSLNVKVSNSTISNTLQDHPEYPSLLAINDSLTEWHVPNQAYHIAKADYDPQDLEFPFIAHLNTNGGSFILVHEIIGDQLVYSDEKYRHAKISEEEFLKQWSGVALHAIANEKSGEAAYRSNALKDSFNTAKIPLLVITLLAIILLSLNFQTLTIGYSLLLLIKLTGITVSILLLMHSIDANNPLIQNLCSLGNKNNCNAILKSDAAKVTSWLSWSEVGAFYFTGSFICLLVSPASIPLLAWLNIFALPYTIYSISYQYRQKNWCILCCTVQLLLLSEFLVNLTTVHTFGLSTINIPLSFTVLLSFLLPVLIWAFLKSFLLRSSLSAPLKQQLKKFKYNSELFKQVLHNQPKYGVSNELMPIILGNPLAETVITMVSNPFCGPCGKAHETLDEWLSYRNDIQLKIIFTTADHDDDIRTKVSRHVTALSLLNDTKLVEKALNDWYKQSNKKFETWAEKYPVSYDERMNVVTEKQKAWCSLAEISFTPTILINGYKLPEPYRLEDIKYLLT